MAMRSRDTLDPLAIADELGLRGPRGPQVLTGGADTATWRIETDDGRAVVRVFRPEQVTAAARERLALQVAHAAGIPVPPILAAGTPAAADGRPTTILGWCEGSVMLDRLAEVPGEARSLGRLLGATQAAIHRVTPPAGWGSDPGDRLLHLDLHPSNILVVGRRVSGVIDWVNAGAGDPRADVARTYAILTADPAAVAVRRADPRTAQAFRRGWLAGYADASADLVGLAPFIADAGASLRDDLGHRLSPEETRRIERWTAGWRRRAG